MVELLPLTLTMLTTALSGSNWTSSIVVVTKVRSTRIVSCGSSIMSSLIVMGTDSDDVPCSKRIILLTAA